MKYVELWRNNDNIRARAKLMRALELKQVSN